MITLGLILFFVVCILSVIIVFEEFKENLLFATIFVLMLVFLLFASGALHVEELKTKEYNEKLSCVVKTGDLDFCSNYDKAYTLNLLCENKNCEEVLRILNE